MWLYTFPPSSSSKPSKPETRSGTCSSANTTFPSRESSTSTTTSSITYDETTALLAHERGPALPPTHPSHHTTQPRHHHRSHHQRQHWQSHVSTSCSAATESLHQVLTLHPRQIALLERERERAEEVEEDEEAEEEGQGMQRCVLSRIDCIEVGLWHERIRDYEAAELGLVSARELGLVRSELDDHGGRQERGASGGEGSRGGGIGGASEEWERDDEERLSRVHTHVNSSTSIADFANLEQGARRVGGKGKLGKRRNTSSMTRFGSVSLSLNHIHPYFWPDIFGICLLVLLIFCLLLYIIVQLRGLDEKDICGRRGGGLWVAVQMFVGLGAGLILQVPVRRGLVPFVLPVWVFVTIGVVVGLKGWAGCIGG